MDSIELILESDRGEIRKFEAVLEEVNKKFNLAVEKFINFQIACSEALVNSIVHGNKEDRSKKVYARITFDERFLEVRLKDQGNGFDISKLPDPTSNENIMKESGRGIFIIRSLVDGFQCHSTSSGTEYILTAKKQS